MASFADQMGQMPGIGAGGLPSPETGGSPGGAPGGGMAKDPLNVLKMLARHGKRRKGSRKKSKK